MVLVDVIIVRIWLHLMFMCRYRVDPSVVGMVLRVGIVLLLLVLL